MPIIIKKQKWTDAIFVENIAVNFPKVMKDFNTQNQEAQRTPWINSRTISCMAHHHSKTAKNQSKKKNCQIARGGIYHLQMTVGLLGMSKSFKNIGEIKIHPHKNREFITSRPELK